MCEEKNLIKNFQNHSQKKKDGYINSYIEKQKNIDPKENAKINNIKIKQALKEFLKDNTVD